jgi:hypothetical protein
MSLDDLRAIQDRMTNLQRYIQKIPSNVAAAGLETFIDNAVYELPLGVPHADLIKNLESDLPQTIDTYLTQLREACETLVEPYKEHILEVISDILTHLQSFRSHHTHVPTETTNHMKINVLLQQLHSMK